MFKIGQKVVVVRPSNEGTQAAAIHQATGTVIGVVAEAPDEVYLVQEEDRRRPIKGSELR